MARLTIRWLQGRSAESTSSAATGPLQIIRQELVGGLGVSGDTSLHGSHHRLGRYATF